jgi:hypothetical protein
MTESEPKEYKFTHKTHVSLDEYKGVAHDMMELNHSVMDGFMRVSDMRKDIVIIQKHQDRSTNYDQVGNVRTGKLLQASQIINLKENKTTQVKMESDAWQIVIDDQELAQSSARSNDSSKKFNDIFIANFQNEIKNGMESCLMKEKLLNGGEYDYSFLFGYLGLFADGLALGTVMSDALKRNLDFTSIVGLTLGIGAINVTINLLKLIVIQLSNDVDIKNFPMNIGPINLFHADWNEPFTRHSLAEYLIPPVPLDRLIRGNIYLDKNRLKLVNKV